MEQALKAKLVEWQECRKLTMDFLASLSDKQLDISAGGKMGSLGKQFRHIGDVQLCYNDAIRTGKIIHGNYKRDYSIEGSKAKLKKYLLGVNNETIALAEKNQDAVIDWGYAKISMSSHINNLIQHEVLHHGEFIVYMRLLGLKAPKQWHKWYGFKG